MKVLCTRSEYETYSLFHITSKMLTNEQPELLVVSVAEYLESSSLSSDDNLIASKETLGTCLDCICIESTLC